MNDDNQRLKLYTLHTTASYKIASEVAIAIASRFGHMALLSETPNGAIVIVPRIVWGAGRWTAVVLTLAAAPFVFARVDLTELQSFGLGWIAAAFVLLSNRETQAVAQSFRTKITGTGHDQEEPPSEDQEDKDQSADR